MLHDMMRVTMIVSWVSCVSNINLEHVLYYFFVMRADDICIAHTHNHTYTSGDGTGPHRAGAGLDQKMQAVGLHLQSQSSHFNMPHACK